MINKVLFLIITNIKTILNSIFNSRNNSSQRMEPLNISRQIGVNEQNAIRITERNSFSYIIE